MSDATEELLQRVRAAKQRQLPLDDGRRTLAWHAPEWEDQFRLGMGGMEAMRAAVSLIDGWTGFTERDMVPPGTDGFGAAPVPFTRAALNAALAADPSVLGQLLTAVTQETQRRKAAQEAASGN